MGKIISHTTYEYYEYVTAILISIGMTLFMLDSSDHKNGNIKYNINVILIKDNNNNFSCNQFMTNTFRWGYNTFRCYFIGRILIVR